MLSLFALHPGHGLEMAHAHIEPEFLVVMALVVLVLVVARVRQ